MTQEEYIARHTAHLADRIGAHLFEHASKELAYATRPEPEAETPGTLWMNYDGSIDLIALAAFVRKEIMDNLVVDSPPTETPSAPRP